MVWLDSHLWFRVSSGCLCYFTGGYHEYQVTLIDFSTKKEAKIVVQRTGGDCAILRSFDGSTLEFVTTSMKV
jgi:hypothetical protein